jgi:hypothetical protein
VACEHASCGHRRHSVEVVQVPGAPHVRQHCVRFDPMREQRLGCNHGRSITVHDPCIGALSAQRETVVEQVRPVARRRVGIVADPSCCGCSPTLCWLVAESPGEHQSLHQTQGDSHTKTRRFVGAVVATIVSLRVHARPAVPVRRRERPPSSDKRTRPKSPAPSAITTS